VRLDQTVDVARYNLDHMGMLALDSLEALSVL
jgi:hypothetical protein